MQRTCFECAKAIAGMGFIAVGAFAFYGNLSQLCSAACTEVPGFLPTLMLTGSRMLQAYAADHREFVQISLLHAVGLFWPLLLAIAGTVLLREYFAADGDALQKKDC